MAFTGKVVLITGASSGIGAETAQHFARLGASVALVARNADNLHAIVDKCATDAAVQPLAIVADVTADSERIVAETVQHFGRLDVLVNNAGRGFAGSIETATLAGLDDALDINLRSVFRLTQLAVPHLLATKGNVVNVSSVAGLRAFPNFLPYCIAKAAIDQFTRCVALELAARGVRVNAVNPAVIVTNFHANAGMDEATYATYLESCAATHALGRPGTTSEVAAAIAFLANNEQAGFVTGTLLAVDGGKAIMCPR